MKNLAGMVSDVAAAIHCSCEEPRPAVYFRHPITYCATFECGSDSSASAARELQRANVVFIGPVV